MAHFSAMLNLQFKPCLIVGAGAVAERKLRKLLEAGAIVTVVSPSATPNIRQWAETGKIKWVERAFERPDVKDATLVVAATNEPGVNLSVYEAIQPGQWINIVDRPDLSDFIFPAVFARGDLQISVSTGGGYPGLAKKLRDKLANEVGPEYEPYLSFLAEIRRRALSLQISEPELSKLLRDFLDDRYIQYAKDGKLDSYKQEAFQRMGELKNKSN